MNHYEKAAQDALRELEPFHHLILKNGASDGDVPLLTGTAIASALMALVEEVRGVREVLSELQSQGSLAESVAIWGTGK